MIDPLCAGLGAVAIAALVAFLLERDRRLAAEQRGRYRPPSKRKRAETAERRAKETLRKEETQRVRKLADELLQHAKHAGIRVSRKEAEEEARKLLLARGAI